MNSYKKACIKEWKSYLWPGPKYMFRFVCTVYSPIWTI